MFFDSIPIIGSVIKSVTDIVGKNVTDKDLANKLTSEIQDRLINTDAQIIQAQLTAQSSIIVAEANGGSWLQRNWRPCLMFLFMAILFNNYILVPYLKCFWSEVPTLEVPPDLWALLKIGVGGYIVGRSSEKVADVITAKKGIGDK
jgi:hypothetical protein